MRPTDRSSSPFLTLPELMPCVNLLIPTPDGSFEASFSSKGLCSLRFPEKSKARTEQQGQHIPREVRVWHRQTARCLKLALAGRAPTDLPPLDCSFGTPFQQSVWEELRRIRPGETKSYGQVAQTIGRPKAVRAVGQACGANPIPVLIPCHRVVAAGRALGGFSGPMAWKTRLLAREGLELPLT